MVEEGLSPAAAAAASAAKGGCSSRAVLLILALVVAVGIGLGGLVFLINGITDDTSSTTTTTAVDDIRKPTTTTTDPNAGPPVGPVQWRPNGAVNTIAIPGADQKPTADQLAPGAVLYEGSSGGEIGCIACDGLFRVMSIEKPGVASSAPGGPAETAALSKPLATDGTIIQLGARVSAPDGGKWTVNVGCRKQAVEGSCASTDTKGIGTVSPIMACSIPANAPACVRWDGSSSTVKKGDRLVLTIGNPGDPVTQGHFTIDWWFVIQPD
jgi:hypothetical protein